MSLNGMKPDDLVRDGCYSGLRKEPPLPRDHKEVKKLITPDEWGRLRVFQGRLTLEYSGVGCCGVRTLNNLKYWHPNSIEHHDRLPISDELFSANIYHIHDLLEENNKIHTKVCDKVVVRKGQKYIITALTEHMMRANLHGILEEYFGFQRLENDFMNWGGSDTSDRICLMGLCFSGFHKEDL